MKTSIPITSGVALLTATLLLPAVTQGQGTSSTGEPRRVGGAAAADAASGRLEDLDTADAAAQIERMRVFEEPLVAIGGQPEAADSRELAEALRAYARRQGPDDFSSLTTFLAGHPHSPWRAALLTCLGTEYYNTAHYSLALEAWRQGWELSKGATEPRARALADRAAGELALMYARLGRRTELEALLKSVEGRVFVGSATEKIAGAREGLWNMQHRPEISFRCGPLALHRILVAAGPNPKADSVIINSASPPEGFSLSEVADLSKEVGLNYQMAFRQTGAVLRVPAVVHWKVGHYAALVREEGGRYLLQDPTFRDDVWATRAALEAEASGYFLVPPGPLPAGWRPVTAEEGATIRGKGITSTSDPGPHGAGDPKSGGGPCKGLAVPAVHLMLVNLNLSDEPVGYSPPVGPAVRFTVRYNHRDAFQPATFAYANLGPKWTWDWIACITDNPLSPSADVKYYLPGGGTRTFTGFNPGTQTFAFEQYDQTRLTRTGPASYELVAPDGSKLVFAQSDGAAGTSRKVFLTQVADPHGNAVTLGYDGSLRLVSLTDAIGQVTTLAYEHPTDPLKITRVTDPFGRFATFDYDGLGRLTRVTDVLGLTSQFAYEATSDFITALVTPYGTNTFTRGGTGTTRWLETLYPDGSRDRVEFNQNTNGIAFSEPPGRVPQGMAVFNRWLHGRNTFYWSRNACATAYGDYSKARLFHWLHLNDVVSTAGILESSKEPLEGRVWYDYDGQNSAGFVGNTALPRHAGRVLDDGSTQLHTFAYNGFGHVTNAVDPLGRELSFLYATNGIDLLEVRQTRGANNELLARMTYNAQHLPLTRTDAAGQTTSYTYNARGQLLTETNPKGETTTYTYDPNGYLVRVDGPLPGTNDSVTATYDALGRVRTRTDESGYTLTFDYDALDRLTRVTFPDGTFSEYVFDRLDLVLIRDRAGRETRLEYDAMRQLVRRTDPLGRTTHFQWCACGDMRSLTDPLGRNTTWNKDVQGRLTSKQYGDGSQVSYVYENTTSRLRQVIDEKQQVRQYTYHRDDTLASITYLNAVVPTPPVSFAYDPNYPRLVSMTDGTGTTRYGFHPITGSPSPGAGELASEDGPLPNDTITYRYDELGRVVTTAIDGVAATRTFDAAGRVIAEVNALGAFTNVYDGPSGRLLLETGPNGQTTERAYAGNPGNRALQRITHKVGATLLSEFLYTYDLPANRIQRWSQQAGVLSPSLFDFAYDAADQLLAANVTNAGVLVNSFAYAYDLVGNRLRERIGATTNAATYNALNQLSTTTAAGGAHTNEWDAEDRLVAVTAGNQRTEFTYDGLGRMVRVRQLVNGTEVSQRRFLYEHLDPCEERDSSGAVTKRFFNQGVKLETGPNAGAYFYTRDHLGTIRELTDAGGAVRARYAYDPFGRRSKLSGDLEADFGFTGLFWVSEAKLLLARFRLYDPDLGRWLSRDPLSQAEEREGPNLYTYVGNNPVNLTDPLGLQQCCRMELVEYTSIRAERRECQAAEESARKVCKRINSVLLRPEGQKLTPEQYANLADVCSDAVNDYQRSCRDRRELAAEEIRKEARYLYCMEKLCKPPPCKESQSKRLIPESLFRTIANIVNTQEQPKRFCVRVLSFPEMCN